MKYVEKGLPVIRVGGLVYFRVESARAWFASMEKTAGGDDAAA
jgi:hypothetical protein